VIIKKLAGNEPVPATTASATTPSARTVEERRQVILDAAEALFAEQGIAGTSVRSILAAAGANVAAVHYHFGSKEKLVEEVFRRRADKIAKERVSSLKRALSDPDETWRLERIIRAFLESGFTGGDTPEGAARFARLRARISTEDSDLARRLLSESFDASSRQFVAAFAAALPQLDETGVAWCFHTMLGVMVYTMANPGRIQALTAGRCDPSDYLAAVDRLVPIIAAMFRSGAPAGKS
jgi:AcrR family transcriptional regulator